MNRLRVAVSTRWIEQPVAKASWLAHVRWLAAYPLAAGSQSFAFGALAKTAGEVAAPVFTVVVGAIVGWECTRENCSERACAGWAALAALLALLLCAVGVGLAYETIYCDNRNCEPLFG
jgi:hypothetical protein